MNKATKGIVLFFTSLFFSNIYSSIFFKKIHYLYQCGYASNFKKVFSKSRYMQLEETFKEVYFFDFIALPENHLERELENKLCFDIKKLISVMGKDFVFHAKQHNLKIDKKDYYIDLLFYNTSLKSYIVVELKSREFNPRDIGQLNFYVSLCDDTICDSKHKKTIGLLLCKSKNDTIAQHALKNIYSPIIVSQYVVEKIHDC